MQLKLLCQFLLLGSVYQSAYARRSLGTAASGTIVPSSAMTAMLQSLQGAKRSLMGVSSAFPAAATDNFMFMTQSITGPQMGGDSQSNGQVTGSGRGSFQAASDPVPMDSRYFQPNLEARQAAGMDPSTSDPLIAMQNPGYLLADYQASHNLGASGQETQTQAMAEYVGSAQGGSDPSSQDLPSPGELLSKNFRSLRSIPSHDIYGSESSAYEEIEAPPSSQVSWDYSQQYGYNDPSSQAYPGYNPEVFAAEMQPGSPSHATYHDPWADPDAYLSLISRMHGHEVALGIKEIMDGIIANEDHMRSLIKQSEVDISPEHGLRKLLELGTAVKVAEQQAAQGGLPPFLPDFAEGDGMPQPSSYAAMEQHPGHVADQNKLFVDTAFLNGGARSFTPFVRTNKFAQRP